MLKISYLARNLSSLLYIGKIWTFQNLFIETSNHFSIAKSPFYGFKVSTSDLDKKIDTIMTDAATKNFQIKKSIGSANASTLQKTHNWSFG